MQNTRMQPEIARIVESELKRFATELKLSDAQTAQLKTVMENGVRGSIRFARSARMSQKTDAPDRR